MLSWHDVERITGGHLGRTMRSACPFCSHQRRQANQRKQVFAVKLIDPEFAVYNCVHCHEAGYVVPDRPSRVVDLTEFKRRREEAERREREDRQERTEAALSIWNERQP